MAKKYTTSAILDGIYPLVNKSLSNSQQMSKYKSMISRFINKRSKDLYDTCPCSRILYGLEDEQDYFKSLNISKSEVESILTKTYYAKIANFNPRAAKNAQIIVSICVVRYFLLKNDSKNLDLACIYLAFSGSMYPSAHYGSFPVVEPSEYRHIMEYVINNELSNKYDIKREGSVIGGIRSLTNTWLNSYKDLFKTFSDDDIVYLIQQLHGRIKSFIQNIAEVYYEAYKNKDSFSFESDNIGGEDLIGDYRVVDNNSMQIEKLVEKSMTYINTNGVDYKIIKMVADQNVKPSEVQLIIETIDNDPEYIPLIKELIRIMITQYMLESKNKDITSVEFISFNLAPKPNSKNKNILRQKEIIEILLNKGTPSYRKRKNRPDTKSSYYKALLGYYAIVINKCAK